MNKSWSKETVLRALVDFVKTAKRYPDNNDFETNPELPRSIVVGSTLGSTWLAALKKRCEEEGIPLDTINVYWTKESVLEAVDKFVKQYNRFPKIKEMCRKNGLPSKTVAQRLLGANWRESLSREYGFIDLATSFTWDDVVKQVKIFQTTHQGRIPRIEEYTRKNQLPTQAQMTELFGPDWSTRMKNEFGVRIPTTWSKELVVERVHTFMIDHGRFPNKGDFKNDPSLPVVGTLYRLYGDYETAKNSIEEAISETEN